MDVNDYVLAALTHDRLQELRAQASVAALRSRRGASRPLRVVVGELLVRLGQRMAGLTPARGTA